MSAEWKPGDVAMSGGGRVLLRVEGYASGCAHADAGREHWHNLHQYVADYSVGAKNASRVVVIDPDDRDAVRRLLESYGRQFTDWNPELDSNVTRLQAALREFADPTQPKCLASVNVRINMNYIAASCHEPKGHDGSHRAENGTCWDATEAQS